MTVYIDNEYRCYAAPGEGRTEAENSFFDGKCAAIIECYRYVPEGAAWTREDGNVFAGEMIAPHKDMTAALEIQKAYEAMEENAGDYVAAYNEGVASVWA